LLTGCGHQYRVVGESDTSKPIAVKIMKVKEGSPPAQLYYTELTGNDTEFVFDQMVDDSGARVEAWFSLRDDQRPPTIYTLPPGKRVRLELDENSQGVAVEKTTIEEDKAKDWDD